MLPQAGNASKWTEQAAQFRKAWQSLKNGWAAGLKACERGKAPLLADAVFAAELVDATAGIDDFLLAGVKRMTCRADLDVEVVTQRGAGREFVTAATGNFHFLVVGVYLGLHWIVSGTKTIEQLATVWTKPAREKVA
jgi:hypothetical protein